MDSSKYTTERRAAFKRVVGAARAFVRAVDEFGEDDFSSVSERHVELINALDAEGRAWGEHLPRQDVGGFGPQTERL